MRAAPLVALASAAALAAGVIAGSSAAIFANSASNGGNAFSTAACFSIADTGLLDPTAEARDTGAADGDGFELNAADAFADGGGYASNIDGDDDRHFFYHYGLNIPAGSCIAGVEVRLDWWLSSTLDTNSMSARLSWDGGVTWTDYRLDGTETTTEHTALLGGPTDTWGRSWTVAELSDANFRVRISSNCWGFFCGFRDFFLDWVPVQVYYNPP